MKTKSRAVSKVIESDDPLWLDIKKGLGATVAGKMKIWKPRYIKSKTQTMTKKDVKSDALWIEFQHVFEDIRKGRIREWKPRTIPDTR